MVRSDDRDLRFHHFVTDAKPTSNGQMGSATIEARVDSGRPWSETYTLSGDRLGQVESVRGREESLDFTTDWYLVDIVTTGSDTDGSKVTEVVLQRIGDPDRVSRVTLRGLEQRERQVLALEVSRASKGGDKTGMSETDDRRTVTSEYALLQGVFKITPD